MKTEHGFWVLDRINENKVIWKCSQCGKDCRNIGTVCESCGAKMDYHKKLLEGNLNIKDGVR